MTENTQDLVAVMQARFQARQGKLKQVVEKERRLREQVAQLEARHRTAQSQYQTDLPGQRVYGGDVLWQAWVGRSRRQLQMGLAQVLVQKGQLTIALQRDHGRKLASEALMQEECAQKKKALLLREIEQQQGLQLNDLAQKKPRF